MLDIKGFDVDKTNLATCFYRTMGDIVAGGLLIAYGCGKFTAGICPNARDRLLAMAENKIEVAMETIAENPAQKNDTRYIAMVIEDTLLSCHKQTRKVQEYLGHGIALGGCIILGNQKTFCATAFGGCCLYRRSGDDKLMPLIGITPDTYIRDAIGAAPHWKPRFIFDFLRPGDMIFATSNAFPEPGLAMADATITQMAGDPRCTGNTLSMMLRRDLESLREPPTAVMEYRVTRDY